MERTPVQSSNIRAVGYDAEHYTLEVEFTSGAVYRYATVPRTLYDFLMTSESKGRFFAQFIRNCYRHERTAQPTTPADE